MVTRSETQDHEKIRDDLLALSACGQRSTPENEIKKAKKETLPTEFEIDLKDTRYVVLKICFAIKENSFKK